MAATAIAHHASHRLVSRGSYGPIHEGKCASTSIHQATDRLKSHAEAAGRIGVRFLGKAAFAPVGFGGRWYFFKGDTPQSLFTHAWHRIAVPVPAPAGLGDALGHISAPECATRHAEFDWRDGFADQCFGLRWRRRGGLPRRHACFSIEFIVRREYARLIVSCLCRYVRMDRHLDLRRSVGRSWRLGLSQSVGQCRLLGLRRRIGALRGARSARVACRNASKTWHRHTAMHGRNQHRSPYVTKRVTLADRSRPPLHGSLNVNTENRGVELDGIGPVRNRANSAVRCLV